MKLGSSDIHNKESKNLSQDKRDPSQPTLISAKKIVAWAEKKLEAGNF